jgi:hypothetical protein
MGFGFAKSTPVRSLVHTSPRDGERGAKVIVRIRRQLYNLSLFKKIEKDKQVISLTLSEYN